MALEKHPDLRIQESQPIFRDVNDKLYIEIKCMVWRDKEDPLPVIAYCWEPFPGTTPYTRDSEQMNASTSALGRALGMMGFGVDHKMASKQEVLARQPEPQVVTRNDGSVAEDPFTDQPQTHGKVVTMKPGHASPKQLGMIRALARARGWTLTPTICEHVAPIINVQITKLDELTKHQASQIIDAWKEKA
jgi:hypothetical protein